MPLLHHAVLRLSEVCGEVVVVLSPGGAQPPLPDAVAVRVARDAREGEGPLAGALAGLAEVRTELAVLAGGDMPDLQPAVLLEMLRRAADGPEEAIALADGDGWRPLPSVVRVRPAAAAARTLLGAGRRRLRDLLAELRVAVVEERAWHALDPLRRTLVDVDVPADLERVRADPAEGRMPGRRDPG
jgi:molybdopterin-guanine dinucleotide biosynthesis protein A